MKTNAVNLIGFNSSGIQLYSGPYAIRSSPSVASFKKTLKTFLFQKAFGDLNVLLNLVSSRFYAVFFVQFT